MVAPAVSPKAASNAANSRGIITGPWVTPLTAGSPTITLTKATVAIVYPKVAFTLRVFLELRATLPEATLTVTLPKVLLIL